MYVTIPIIAADIKQLSIIIFLPAFGKLPDATVESSVLLSDGVYVEFRLSHLKSLLVYAHKSHEDDDVDNHACPNVIPSIG